jgi:uncharacterized NAD-dependent epimerase/dehydratase family protein
VTKYNRLAILAEGKLGVVSSKTAACIIRYQPHRVACVIDSTRRGRSLQSVLGFGEGIPVVGSIAEALPLAPDSLLIGIAPRGGSLPDEWRAVVIEAIDRGLHVLTGLHTMLGEDPEISQAARRKNVDIWDIRKVTIPETISTGALRDRQGRVILTVGSDCSSGKMTVAFELARYLKEHGYDTEFVATGQTGILLAGWGVAIDRVPGDFMSRVIEDLTLKALAESGIAIVEGQGSLIHPAYSGVSLSILHGCCPDAMILCHQASRQEIEDYGITIPSARELVRTYEEACAIVFPSRVVAVALNTYDISEDQARAAVARLEDETGLPVTDVIRWGCDRIYNGLEAVL